MTHIDVEAAAARLSELIELVLQCEAATLVTHDARLAAYDVPVMRVGG